MIPRILICIIITVAIPAIVKFVMREKNIEEPETNEHYNEDAESRLRKRKRKRSMNCIKSWIDNNEPKYSYFENIDDALSCSQFFDAVDEVKAIGISIAGRLTLRDNVEYSEYILQLASHSGVCLLIELRNNTIIPANLKDTLENEGIIKVGLADGYRAFLIRHGIQLKGYFDLRSIYKEDRATLIDLAETHLNSELPRPNPASWFDYDFREDKKYHSARRVHMCIRLLMKKAMYGTAQVPDGTSAEKFVGDCICAICDAE